ncbi:transglycosylase family protein [Miltoncostaea marina]|uniref:transglycosylase family protein n=1 Tax=Miltoncostaea marina TaxID=2843215 RepID=UPI001C3CDD92|nr:transglycosylase family protein [Miltoncostaea marina]
MHRRLLLAAGLALAGALAVLGVHASAAPQVIDAQRSEVRELEAQVLAIDARAGEAADAHAAAVRRAEDLRRRIAETDVALAEARRAHRVSVERLGQRLRALYAQERPTLVEIMLTSGGLTEAVDAQRALESIGRRDREVVEQLERTRGRLTALRAELERSRAGVDASVRESRERLQELEGLIADRRSTLAQARSRLDRLVAAEAAAAERRRAAAAAAAADALAERALRDRAGGGAPAATGPAPAAAAAPSAPAPAAPAAPASPAPSSGGAPAHLERIAQCESGGNPRAVSASGQYRGKYQFDPGTWQSLGGTGDPAAAPEAEQDRLAALLYAQRGPAPWPVCGYR